MGKQKILVTEDEYNVADTIKDSLTKEGYEVVWQSSGEKALEYLKSNTIDLALLDIGLPGISGLEVLTQIKENYPDIPVIMLTASDRVDTAVGAMKIGASDYINKPFELSKLLFTIKKSLNEKQLNKNQEKVLNSYKYENIVGGSKIMQKVYEKIHQAANSTANVLLLGETGTGKELIAKTIHINSPRKNGPFKAVNCNALTETLIESELFGYEKGAFTGAAQSKPGAIELANGGTLFLDEIGDFNREIQVKLLRVLEERKVTYVGGTKEIRVDIRLICATNKNITELVKTGESRKDFFYRINTFPIMLPSLKERKEDIPLLIQYFLKEFKKNYGENSFSAEAIEILSSYEWPGNIRELKNVIENMLVSLHGAKQYNIYAEHIPKDIRAKVVKTISTGSSIPIFDNKTSLKELLQPIESEIIREAISKHNGNLTQIAQVLKISYPTLKSKMAQLGIK